MALFVSLPLSLSSAEVDALLADLGAVAVRQYLEIARECADANRLVVPLLVERAAEEDVIAHGCILDPRLLRAVANATADLDRTADRLHLAEQTAEERGFAEAGGMTRASKMADV